MVWFVLACFVVVVVPQTGAEAQQKRAGISDTAGPAGAFRDCPICPEMVVIPAGEFLMGAAADEGLGGAFERPQHRGIIRKPFAVGKFEVTFAEWGACVTGGGCVSNQNPNDQGWGRGKRPVIDVSWNDARMSFIRVSMKNG